MGVPTEADDLLVALAVPTKLPNLGVCDNAERLALAVRRHYFDFDKVATYTPRTRPHHPHWDRAHGMRRAFVPQAARELGIDAEVCRERWAVLEAASPKFASEEATASEFASEVAGSAPPSGYNILRDESLSSRMEAIFREVRSSLPSSYESPPTPPASLPTSPTSPPSQKVDGDAQEPQLLPSNVPVAPSRSLGRGRGRGMLYANKNGNEESDASSSDSDSEEDSWRSSRSKIRGNNRPTRTFAVAAPSSRPAVRGVSTPQKEALFSTSCEEAGGGRYAVPGGGDSSDDPPSARAANVARGGDASGPTPARTVVSWGEIAVPGERASLPTGSTWLGAEVGRQLSVLPSAASVD